jgi:WD40 repeat protein
VNFLNGLFGSTPGANRYGVNVLHISLCFLGIFSKVEISIVVLNFHHKQLKSWRAATMPAPKKLCTRRIQFGSVREAAVSPDGLWLLSLGEGDGLVIVVNKDTLQQSSEYNLSAITNYRIMSVASIPTDGMLILADEDHQIYRFSWPNVGPCEPFATVEFDVSMIALEPSGRFLAVTGSADPQILMLPLTASDNPIQIFDNSGIIIFMSFAPTFDTLISVNADGEIYSFDGPLYGLNKEYSMKCQRSGITWTDQSQLLIADSEARGILKLFEFRDDAEVETIKIDSHSGSIRAIALSKSGLLASSDSSQLLIISNFKRYMETKRLSILVSLRPECDLITHILWFGNNMLTAAEDGSFTFWEEIEVGKTSEIQAVQAVMESDEELEDISSDSDEIERKSVKHLPLKGKHEMIIPSDKSAIRELKPKPKPKPKRRKKMEEDIEIPVAIGSDEILEEEEDESDKPLRRNKFVLDEASEGSYESSVSSDSEAKGKLRPVIEAQVKRPPKQTNDEMFDRLREKYVGQEESSESSSSVSDNEHDLVEDKEKSLRRVREQQMEERRQKKMDKQFIAKESGESSSSGEDGEDLIDDVSDREDVGGEDEEVVERFMPGSTPDFVDGRQVLSWNLVGAVFLRENWDESQSIDIEYANTVLFHGQSFDNQGSHFLLGWVSESGVVLASRGHLRYRNHDSWAPDSEFTAKLAHNETIDLVASGDNWCAMATDLRRLRLFLSSGFEIGVIALDSRPVSMIGGGDLLFVAFSTSYKLFNVKKRKVKAVGRLPEQGPIKWSGFDQSSVYVMSSGYRLFALIFSFGVQWVPVCEVPRNFFPIGVTRDVEQKVRKLMGVVLDEGEKWPVPNVHQPLKGIALGAPYVDNAWWEYLQTKSDIQMEEDRKKRNKTMKKADRDLVQVISNALDAEDFDLVVQLAIRIQGRKARSWLVHFLRVQDMDKLGDHLERIYKEMGDNEGDKVSDDFEVKEEVASSANEKNSQENGLDEGEDSVVARMSIDPVMDDDERESEAVSAEEI